MTSGLNYAAPAEPPPPPPEGSVLFDYASPGENAITPVWLSPNAADVGEGFYLRNLGDAGSFNGETGLGPQKHDGGAYLSIVNASALGALANWTGDACRGGGSSTLNGRRVGWGLLDSYTGLVHLMDSGDGSIGASDWQLHIVGKIRHGRAAGGGGTYYAKHLDVEFFSSTNSGAQSMDDVRLVDSMARGTDATFDETIDLDPDTQSFSLITLSVAGTEHWVLFEELFIELLIPAGS
jgi:hypothetical protein